jgi:uncharacterized protein with PCYCGC motif
MFKNFNPRYAIAAALLIIAAISYQAYNSLNTATVPNPEANLTETLDPNQFKGDLHQAYAAAQAKRLLFIELPIFCDKAEKLGRKNLYQCFTDDLATKCTVCVDEAVIADNLSNRGVPPQSIIPILNERFGHGS